MIRVGTTSENVKPRVIFPQLRYESVVFTILQSLHVYIMYPLPYTAHTSVIYFSYCKKYQCSFIFVFHLSTHQTALN